MVYQMDPGQAKLAEKLLILNNRAVGMLTRIYNIKKACADPKSKPAFLTDKNLEGAIKHVIKKFPICDTRSNTSTFNYANSIKDDIIKNLSLYYYTFADLLELKDHIMALMTLMDACQCQLDISLNYELTTGYLNLVVTLISLMWLLSRVDDRKAVLGLFNAAYDMSQGQSEPSFPRLGQMIIDYDNPFKKLQEDLGPLNRLMINALRTLAPLYARRNVRAETWRSYQILSLTSNPAQIIFAAQTETIACEYISLDVMDRWIILCTMACPVPMLGDATVSELWNHAIQMGVAMRIFRDEVLMIHPTAQAILEGIKGLNKRASEIKEMAQSATHESPIIHMERRMFLRGALKELVLLLKEQPGLLGPKILFVWMGLSFSRDEVIWLLRHIDSWPQSSKKNAVRVEDLVDRQLPELIHYMLELRDLVAKYAHIIHNYYLQYVTGYDAHVAAEMLGNLNGKMSEHEGIILNDWIRDIGGICSDTSLVGLRVDWFRLQAAWSMSSSSFGLENNKKLAVLMNTTIFHIKMIDRIDETLRETSDLSIYCFYSRQMETQWKAAIDLPIMCRFVLAYARICAHFPDAVHEMCPEEKGHIMEKSLALCNSVLDEASRAAIHVVSRIAEYELRLTEQTTPTQVASRIAIQIARQKATESGAGAKALAAIPEPTPMAGEESIRRDRTVLTVADKLTTNIIELCAGIRAVKQLTVASHLFNPKEYLAQQLETTLFEMVILAVGTSKQDPNSNAPILPRRPSQLWLVLQAYMSVYQRIDSYIPIDMTRIFARVFGQQSQPMDVRGRETLTSIYTKWYLEVLLRRASNGSILFSEHMKQMVAVPSGDEQLNFAPEQYTDPLELRALVHLIGPYGVKYLSERLSWHVASQIGELNKIVLDHRDLLHRARTQFDQRDEMRDVYDTLCRVPKDVKNGVSPADAIVQRTTIIGEIFAFRECLQAALKDVVSSRLPYLARAFSTLRMTLPEEDQHTVSEMASALGDEVSVDIALANAVKAQTGQSLKPDEHYNVSCLLFIAIAVCLPRVAASPLSEYKPLLRLSLNNTHCLSTAIATMASALFFLHGHNDAKLRMREFLAIATSSILRVYREDSTTTLRKDGEPVIPPILPIIIDKLVDSSLHLTHDELETCFPYEIIRCAYLNAHRSELGNYS